MGLAVLLTRLLKVEHAFWVVLGVLPVLSAKETSATRTFWQEQGGTLIGCLVGASLVTSIGAHQGWYWLTLPFIVFASAYAYSAVGFMAGQAAFTVFAVVLFCILCRNGGTLESCGSKILPSAARSVWLWGHCDALGRPDLAAEGKG